MTDETAQQAEARRIVVELMRQQQADRYKQQERQRRGKECPIQRPMFDKW